MRGPILLSRSRAASLAAGSLALVWALVDCSSSSTPAGSGFTAVDAGTGHASTDAHGADSGPVLANDAGMPMKLGPGCMDCDHDGYLPPEDCNDNDPLVNPGAFDFVGDGIDNDCDGKIDDPILTCETHPKTAPGTPLDFARAADLCGQIVKTHTGLPYDPVVEAVWGDVSGLGDGMTLQTSTTKPEQINIVSGFGANKPQAGLTMFGLSNGPWGASTPRTSPALDPVGFNLANACTDIPLLGDDCLALTGNKSAAGVSVQDWAELRLKILVPVNAGGLSFDFSFFSSEFNEWWQSSANDAFFALVTSEKIAGANVAKDSHGLAVTVNSGFFELCPEYPGPPGVAESEALQQCVGLDGSAMVPGSLAGTGYDGAGTTLDAGGALDTAVSVEGTTYVYGGGTGWLRTTFPVTPKETFELRIMVMDTFDGIKDSMVLVDHFAWIPLATAPTGAGVARPPTPK